MFDCLAYGSSSFPGGFRDGELAISGLVESRRTADTSRPSKSRGHGAAARVRQPFLNHISAALPARIPGQRFLIRPDRACESAQCNTCECSIHRLVLIAAQIRFGIEDCKRTCRNLRRDAGQTPLPGREPAAIWRNIRHWPIQAAYRVESGLQASACCAGALAALLGVWRRAGGPPSSNRREQRARQDHD